MLDHVVKLAKDATKVSKDDIERLRSVGSGESKSAYSSPSTASSFAWLTTNSLGVTA